MTTTNDLEQIQNLDNLKDCGFSDEQARGILKAMSQNVATKSDVEIAKLELKRDIEKVRSDLSKDIEKIRANLSIDIEKVRKEIAELKGDLTYRMFYFFLATVAVLGSLMAWMRFFVPVIVQN